MAKKTTSSKALGYQESFFANRNDMLQSALDAVLLKIDNEQARYQAEVELYKEASKLVIRERERLQKTVDSLKKAQIDKDLAVAQFNAGQKNSTARTSAGIEAANARFNAKQAALAAYYGSRGFSAGRDPSDQVTVDQVRRAFTANPNDINAGLRAYLTQARSTAGVPKTAEDIQKGYAIGFTQQVDKEFGNPKYDIFDDPADRLNAAKDTVFESITDPADRARVELGLVKLNPQGAAAAGLVIDSTGNVSVGGIDVNTVGQVDYSGLIADTEARLGRIKDAEAKAPVAPEEPDLIDLQRREYFDKFYSGYVPRYEMNEIMQKLIDLPDSEAQAFKDLYQSRYSPVAGMETPAGARRVRDLPTTPGGVIYGEGSPFVPTDSFVSVTGPQRQASETVESLNQKINALQKEMAAATAGEAGGLSPFNIFASRADPTSLIGATAESLAGKQAALDSLIAQRDLLLEGRKDVSIEDMRRAQQNVAVDQSQPLDQSIDDLVQELARIDGALKKAYSPQPISPDVAGIGSVSISKEQISALEMSKREIEDQLDNLLMRRIEAGSGPEQQIIKSSDMVLDSGRSYLGDFPNMDIIRRETEPVLDFGEPRRVQPPGQPNILFTGDRAEVRRILNDPERQRYKAPFKITEPPAPAPAPPRKKIDLGEQEQVSDFEISKTQFVEDPTNSDYR